MPDPETLISIIRITVDGLKHIAATGCVHQHALAEGHFMAGVDIQVPHKHTFNYQKVALRHLNKLPLKISQKLQLAQNVATKPLTRPSYTEHISAVHMQLHGLLVHFKQARQKLPLPCKPYRPFSIMMISSCYTLYKLP